MAPALRIADDYLEALSFTFGQWDGSKALCLGSTDSLLLPDLVGSALASYDRPDPAACRANRGCDAVKHYSCLLKLNIAPMLTLAATSIGWRTSAWSESGGASRARRAAASKAVGYAPVSVARPQPDARLLRYPRQPNNPPRRELCRMRASVARMYSEILAMAMAPRARPRYSAAI